MVGPLNLVAAVAGERENQCIYTESCSKTSVPELLGLTCRNMIFIAHSMEEIPHMYTTTHVYTDLDVVYLFVLMTNTL